MLKFFPESTTFYFIGIGGVSMSALAAFLIGEGYGVSGSDAAESCYTERLRSLGVRVYVPHSAQNIRGENVIIYNSAIPRDNVELTYSYAVGKMIFSRAEFLSFVAGNFSHSIFIAGSHGKTTATAMLSHIFFLAHKNFACHIGGNDLTFKNFFFQGEKKDFFISEACEYKKNISFLRGETAVLLNADPDHMECYSCREELNSVFLDYLNRARNKIVPAEGFTRVNGAVTFGFSGADYYAENIASSDEKYSFDIVERDEFLCGVKLNVRGRHNILNALAAAAAAGVYGIGGEQIKEGLQSFLGVERRFEFIGLINGARVYCDYAHHPKELSAVISTAEKITDGKLYIIFQPHTYSRTKYLMDEFVAALKGIKRLLIYSTFPAREEYDRAGSALTLAENVGCGYADSVNALRSFVGEAGVGDTVLFLGAGDIYSIAKIIVGEKR